MGEYERGFLAGLRDGSYGTSVSGSQEFVRGYIEARILLPPPVPEWDKPGSLHLPRGHPALVWSADER